MSKQGFPGTYQYQGQFTVPLDERWEFRLPMELRKQLLERTEGRRELLITCLAGLWVYTTADAEEMRTILLQYPIGDHVSAARMIAAGEIVKWSSSGTVQIPDKLRSRCKIKPSGTLVMLGKKDRIEIWDQDRMKTEYVEIMV